jgi:hypothetical protein
VRGSKATESAADAAGAPATVGPVLERACYRQSSQRPQVVHGSIHQKFQTKPIATRKKEFLIAATPGLLDKYSNQHWFITIFRSNLSTGINLNA